MSRSTKVAAALRFSRFPLGEVVDGEHVVAALDETVDEVRSDEPGSTGDDRPHASVS